VWLGRVLTKAAAEGSRRQTEVALVEMRGRLDTALARVDAGLEHRNLVLGRLADIEVEGMRLCWRRARRAGILLNGLRPIDSGTDLVAFQLRHLELGAAHNRLLNTYADYEPFFEDGIRSVLDELTRLLRLELSQSNRDIFKGGGGNDWWDQGETNRVAYEASIEALRIAIRARVTSLWKIADPAGPA
jgi:hypothetical protein